LSDLASGISRRREAVALQYSGLDVPDAIGIEKHGFIEGAIFVLNLPNSSWVEAISKPVSSNAAQSHRSSSRRREGPVPASDLMASGDVHAEYRGYGRWRVSGERCFLSIPWAACITDSRVSNPLQNLVQHGDFMIVCLKCESPEKGDEDMQNRVKGQLESSMFSRQVSC
jgi:hypothetical protein